MLASILFDTLTHLAQLFLPRLLLLVRSPFLFGYAKPVPVDFRSLQPTRIGMVLVAAAGPTGDGGQALLVRPEPAIRGSAAVIVLSASVGLGGLFDAHRGADNWEQETLMYAPVQSCPCASVIVAVGPVAPPSREAGLSGVFAPLWPSFGGGGLLPV